MGLLRLVGLLAAAYLVGSIPTGLWLGRLVSGVDVRSAGSGRTGATNVTRVVGLGAGLLVLAADVAKGLAAVYLVAALGGGPASGALGGLAAVIGHDWPLLAGFRGGRGVATAAGAFIAFCPPAFLLALALMAAAIGLTRYVSLGSMVAAVSGAVGTAVFWNLHLAPDAALLFAVPGSAVVLLRHADNLQRILHGREHRLGQRASRQAPPVPSAT